MVGQPGVHLGDAVRQQGQVAVVVEQPGLDTRTSAAQWATLRPGCGLMGLEPP
jgi:hypothetical protein